MSTEPQPPAQPQPPAHPNASAPHAPEPNPLAEKFSSVWHDLVGGKIIGYKFMGIGLIVFAIIGVYLYISSTGRTADSAKWTALERAGTVKELEDISKNYPNSTVAKVARLHLARVKLGPNGIEALSKPTIGGRNTAVMNIEAAKDELQKLAEEFKNDPVFKAECYLALAKAEAALLGAEKEGAKGNITKLLEYLDKLAEIDDKAPWCVDAKKFAAAIRDTGAATRDELVKIQQELYDIPPPPTSPFGGPGMGGGLGGPGGIGGIGGLPGGI
jgi:hypothetical protein